MNRTVKVGLIFLIGFAVMFMILKGAFYLIWTGTSVPENAKQASDAVIILGSLVYATIVTLTSITKLKK